jgi:acetyl-CoA synthetase (ADP-forming)
VPQEKIEEKVKKVIKAQAEGLANLIKTHGRPLIGYTYQTLGEPFIRALVELGVPVFPGPERAVAAIKALLAYETIKARLSRS